VLVIPMEGKKVSGRHSALRPSERDLPGRGSGMFRHKNTPCLK
jgi:hypothetical protein